MSWLSSWMHPERGYQAAQDQLSNYYNQAQGYLNPYNQHGNQQYSNLNQYIMSLMDPQALQDKWSSGWKESEAAKQLEGLASQHGLNAASSMGLMGSTPALQAIQAGTSGIAAQDRQNYLNDLMQKYMSGAGLSQNIYGIGANAAGQMGNNAMNQGQNMAGLEFNKTNAPGSLFGGIMGGIGKGALDYLTGGYGQGGMGRGVWATGGS
jgi:hypothetical protein